MAAVLVSILRAVVSVITIVVVISRRFMATSIPLGGFELAVASTLMTVIIMCTTAGAVVTVMDERTLPTLFLRSYVVTMLVEALLTVAFILD